MSVNVVDIEVFWFFFVTDVLLPELFQDPESNQHGRNGSVWAA